MHKYWYTKEQILELSPSQVWVLMEMIWYMKNPEWLKKYKNLKFNTEFEFEQYLLNTMKFI